MSNGSRNAEKPFDTVPDLEQVDPDGLGEERLRKDLSAKDLEVEDTDIEDTGVENDLGLPAENAQKLEADSHLKNDEGAPDKEAERKVPSPSGKEEAVSADRTTPRLNEELDLGEFAEQKHKVDGWEARLKDERNDHNRRNSDDA